MRYRCAPALALIAAAGTASAQTYNWAGPIDGNWNNAALWSPAGVPDTAGESAVLGLVDPYTVQLDINPAIDALSVTGAAATLDVLAGRVLSLGSGGLLNDSLIQVNPGGSTANTAIHFFAGGSLTGSGLITLRRGSSDANDAALRELGGFGITHAATHTIAGSGVVDGVIANEGLILANDPAFALQVQGTITQGATGVLRADAATLGMTSLAITGGLLEGVNGGVVSTVGNGTVLGDLTIQGEAAAAAGTTLSLTTPGIVNQGTLTVNPTASSANTSLRFDADAAILGAGEVVMVRGTADANDASLATATDVTGTIGASQTVRGSGLVTGTFVNNGLLLADDPAQALEFAGTVTQDPLGTIAADGTTAFLRNVTVAGGLLDSANLGIVDTAGGNTATLDGVTNQGAAGVRGGGVLAVAGGGVTNNGSVTVNSAGDFGNATMRFDADAIIDGVGDIVLNQTSTDPFDAQISTSAGVIGAFGPGQTVSGRGRLSGDFVNAGLVVATQSGLELQAFGSIDQTAGGELRGDDGVLALGTVLVTNGFFDGQNGGIVETLPGSTSTVSGVTSLGAAGVRGGGVMAIGPGGLANLGALTVNSRTEISNALLRFDADATVSGAGRIDLNQNTSDFFDARITTSAGVTGTNGDQHTIAGHGLMDGDFANDGLILADRANLDLRISGTVDQAGGGTLRADQGHIGLATVTVTGGAFDGINGGRVETIGGSVSTVSDVTSTGQAGVRQGGTMAIGAGGLVNHGTLTVNSLGEIGNALLRFDANATLGGSGRVQFNQTTTDIFDARITTADSVIGTNGAAHTIAGHGSMDGDFINNGTILGDTLGEVLIAAGDYDQTGGGVMRGDGGFVGLGSGSVTGGTFDGVNGGRVDVLNGALSLVSGVTMTGDNAIRGGGTMALTGDITNNGELLVNETTIANATLRADAGVAVGGVGTIRLNQTTSDTFDARIDATTFTITLGSGQTLTGHGRLDGDILCQGVMSPGVAGSADSIAWFGALTLNAGASYAVDVSDVAHDQITGSADVTLDGSLDVSVIPPFEPAFGDTFAIITAGSVAGEFASINGPALPGSWEWRVRYDATQAVLVVTCPADSNLDGQINTLDFLDYLNLWSAGDLKADWNGDGTVNTLDFLAFLNDWVMGC